MPIKTATRLLIEENKRKQQFLNQNGIKIKIDGSWGPWLLKLYLRLTLPSHGIFTNSLLLEIIRKLGHKATINKRGQLVTMSGAPLVYNYDNNRFEFLNSRGEVFWLDNNGKFKTYKNIKLDLKKLLLNKLKFPALYQTILEDKAFVDYRRNINESKSIPFVQDKKIVIKSGKSKGVPISSNLIDSIKVNLPNYNNQEAFLGVASRETDIGKYAPYTVKIPGENANFSRFEWIRKTTPTDLVNDHLYYISPMRGTLNTIFKAPSNSGGVIGHPNVNYLDYVGYLGRIENLLQLEDNLINLRRWGTFNPDVKRTENDYYNPEDNPYLHAILYFYDKNYNMGPGYPVQVRKGVDDIKYLLQ